MTITVKLFATLRQYHDKVMTLTVKEGITVQEVIEKLSLPEEEVSIIMINGRGSGRDDRLQEGDVLALFPAVGGG